VWTFESKAGDTEVVAPISFPLRLSEEIGAAETHFQGEAGFATNCPGTVIEPNALSGHLCVYFGGAGTPTAGATFVNFTDPTVGVPGAAVAGSLMHFTVTGAAHGYGTWAVRGL